MPDSSIFSQALIRYLAMNLRQETNDLRRQKLLQAMFVTCKCIEKSRLALYAAKSAHCVIFQLQLRLRFLAMILRHIQKLWSTCKILQRVGVPRTWCRLWMLMLSSSSSADIWVTFDRGKDFHYLHINTICRTQEKAFSVFTVSLCPKQLPIFLEKERSQPRKHGAPTSRPQMHLL